MAFKKKLIISISRLFNWYFDFYTGGKKRPVFFEVEKTCRHLKIVDDNFEIVGAELKEVLKDVVNIPTYHDIDSLQYAISAVKNPEKKWKTYMLYMMGEFSETAFLKCPQTCSFLKEIPELYQSFFSILEANKEIPAHKGLYRGYLRYHLAFETPKLNAPILRIKNILYTWKKQESILFDDSWEHEVINKSDERRIVLIIDIYRPMPYLPDKINHFVTKYLIKKFYADKILTKLMQ
jgi:aspartate beta-hydroxylase/beta-hydroxylase